MGALGLLLMVGAAYAASSNRKLVRLRLLPLGVGVQFLFAYIVLQTPVGTVFAEIAKYVTRLIQSSEGGSRFVFGPIGSVAGQFGIQGLVPNASISSSPVVKVGFIFAFQVLPSVIFLSSVFAILHHVGIIPLVISFASRFMQRLLNLSGAEGTYLAANLFMDQTSATLAIRPFLDKLTVSELFTIMVSGMARVSAPSMAAYVALGHVEMKHLLAAVILTGPGSVMFSKMLEPEVETPSVAAPKSPHENKAVENVIDAAVQGASDGVHLSLMMVGVLIASVSFIELLNLILGDLSTVIAGVPRSLSSVLGKIGFPFAWIIGVPWENCSAIGNLLATRFVGNEFIAFEQLGTIKQQLHPRSFVLATYALCGFANLTSIAVQVGAFGVLIPHRRADVARLGLRACAAATLANLTAACIVGLCGGRLS